MLSRPNSVGTRLASYSGIDTITRTLPVCGSIATTAPLRPPSAAYAACVPCTLEVRDHVEALALAPLEAR